MFGSEHALIALGPERRSPTPAGGIREIYISQKAFWYSPWRPSPSSCRQRTGATKCEWSALAVVKGENRNGLPRTRLQIIPCRTAYAFRGEHSFALCG